MTILLTLMVLGAAALIPSAACYFCRTCKLARCGNAFAPEVNRRHQIIVQTGNVITLGVIIAGLELLHGWQLGALGFALLIAFGIGEVIGLRRARGDETHYDNACASLYQQHMEARGLRIAAFDAGTPGMSDDDREVALCELRRVDVSEWEAHEAQRRRLYFGIFQR